MNDLAGMRVLVLGAGRSGVAAARLAKAHGASVVVLDSAPPAKLSAVAEELFREGIDMHAGSVADRWDGPEVSRVIVSPGVALDSPMHRLGESTGAPMVGELEFGASYLKCPKLAITGTNGKTTTTELLTACLGGAGFRAMAAGNIGLPLSQVALDAPELDYLVVEVSSFQLEHATSFQPQVGVLLNVTPDHLDRHGSFEAYRSLKTRLLEQVAPGGHAVYHAALESAFRLPPSIHRDRLWLRCEEPQLEGRPEAAEWRVEAGGLHRLAPEEGTLRDVPILGRSCMQLRGSHNLSNALAVVAVMSALDIPLERYRAALCNFQSGPHRIQLIATHNGVQYVDDSKATDVDAMRQALLTLGPSAGKAFHLIAGGLDKGCSLDEAKTELTMYVKEVFLIGSCRHRLSLKWGEWVPCRECDSLEEAVSLASGSASAGDTVLLSPGCASMDMFQSYEERGQRFAEAVAKLP